MKKFLHNRALPFLLCFTLLLGVVAYKPPKAEAVAGVDDAVFGSMALASYMTATGVPLTVIEGGAGAVSAGLSSVAGSYAAATGAASGEAVLGTIAAGATISTAGTVILTAAAVAACAALVAWLISEKGVTEGGDAVEVAKVASGFSASECSKTNQWPFSFLQSKRSFYADWFGVFENLGINSQVFVMSISSDYFFGFYFDNDGVLWEGVFVNPYGAVNSSYFGFYELSSLEHFCSFVPVFGGYTPDAGSSYYSWRVFYDKSYAEAWDGFLTGGCFAFDWSVGWGLCNYPKYYSNEYVCAPFFIKEAINSSWCSEDGSSFVFWNDDMSNERNWGASWSGCDYIYTPTEFTFDNSTLSVSVPDGTTVPDTEAMTSPNTYYVTNVNVTNAENKDDFYEKLLALALANNLTATGEVAEAEESEIDDTQTGTGESSGTVVDEESKGFLAYIPQIFEQIKSIPSAIAEKISELFTLDEALVSEIVSAFKEKFSFVSTLNQLVNDLYSMTPETDPPVIYVHLENAESKYGYNYGGTEVALDLSWYQKYKASVDGILSGFLWLGYLWLLFKRAPGIINGLPLSNDEAPRSVDTPNVSSAPRLERGDPNIVYGDGFIFRKKR